MVGGGYWLVREYRQNQAEQRRDAAAYEADGAEKQLYDPCARAAGVVDGIDCIIREVKAYREGKRSEYDLEAQQDMAAWALWMVLISGASVVVTGVGIIFVKMTLTDDKITANRLGLGDIMTAEDQLEYYRAERAKPSETQH